MLGREEKTFQRASRMCFARSRHRAVSQQMQQYELRHGKAILAIAANHHQVTRYHHLQPATKGSIKIQPDGGHRRAHFQLPASINADARAITVLNHQVRKPTSPSRKGLAAANAPPGQQSATHRQRNTRMSRYGNQPIGARKMPSMLLSLG